MNRNYIIVGTDEYGDNFVFTHQENQLWFIDDAISLAKEYQEAFPEYKYRVAKFTFLD